jgi:hypothetical protein
MGDRNEPNRIASDDRPFITENNTEMNQNYIAAMLRQFDEVLHPTLKDRYQFRSGSKTGVWYLTCQQSGAIYSLIFDGEPPAWRVGNITGLTTVQNELAEEVQQLCKTNP